MRQILFSLFFLAPLWAQPDFERHHFARIGDSGEYLGLTAENAQPGPAGIGVTWDYSGLSPKPEDDFSLRFDYPHAAPNPDDYPGTDLVGIRIEGDSTAYDYLQIRGNRIFVLGSEVSDVGVFRFTDVSFYASFPLAFSQTQSDPIDGGFQFTSILGPTGSSRLDGTATMDYDGFGSLVLPDGRRIEGVRRITFVREWDESGTIGGTGFSAHQKETRYHFVAGDHSAPIFELILTEQSVTPDGGETTVQNTRAAAYRVSNTSNPALTARRSTHLTNQGGAFDSLIIAHNPTENTQTVTLQPIDGLGVPLAQVQVILAAGATWRSLAQDFFDADAASLRVEGCEACSFSVGYRANRAVSSTAQVHQTQTFRTEFSFYPGEWQVLFDGQAVINTGDRPARISVSQIDFDGNLLGNTLLETALAPAGKHLSLINDLFANHPDSLIKLESDVPMAVLVLRISSDFRFLYQNNPLPVFVDADAGRWLAHITSDSGGFVTDILVHNRSDQEQTLNFLPFDSSGTMLGAVAVVLPGGATRRFAKTALFTAQTSHVSLTGSTDCIASAGYRALAPGASTAVVHEAAPVGRSFSIFPGNWDVLFDGLALINTGDEPATISLTQIGDDGQPLTTVVLVDGLAPNAKFLGLLEGRIPNEVNALIKVTSTQPMALLSLRLSKDNLYLYNNDILPR